MATGETHIGTLRDELRAPGDQNSMFTHELEESGSMHGGGPGHRALGPPLRDTAFIPDPYPPAVLSNRSGHTSGT